jgi:hypothetical protein
MYAIANPQAAAAATIIASTITARDLKAAKAAARRGRLYVRSTRVR